MHKQEFVKYLAQKNRRSQQYYATALTEILAGLTDQLRQGKEVRLTGFGTFYVRTHQAQNMRHVATKTPIDVPATRYAAFRQGDLLKLALRKKKQPEPKQKKRGFLGFIR